MKKLPYFLKIATCMCAVVLPVRIFAQSEPNVQKQSLRAPATIAIDGKATEWGNQFEAHNHATDLFYSIANNDENLYLVFHCTDVDALTKIMASGINFTVNKGKDNNAVSIVFPYYPTDQPNNAFTEIPKTNPGSSISDSLMKVYNTRLNNKVKYIKVSGVPGIDSVLSIYNQNSIKAKGAFDNHMAYTYEVAFPLKG